MIEALSVIAISIAFILLVGQVILNYCEKDKTSVEDIFKIFKRDLKRISKS